MNDLQTAVIREYVTPMANHQRPGFDVFAWLDANPTTRKDVEAANSTTEIAAIFKRDLRPYLDSLVE